MAGLVAVAIAATPLGIRAGELARVTVGGQTIDEYIASRSEYALPLYNVGELRDVAELLRETTTPEQRVFVWGYAPTIYVRAQRHTVSRFLYNFPLRTGWRNAEYKTELMRALRAQPPDVFVVASEDRYYGLTGSKKDSAELLREFEDLNDFVASRYALDARIGRYSVFRLEPRGGPARSLGRHPSSPPARRIRRESRADALDRFSRCAGNDVSQCVRPDGADDAGARIDHDWALASRAWQPRG